MNPTAGRVALLWRGEPNPSDPPHNPRLVPIFEALQAEGVVAEAVVFSEAAAGAVKRRLMNVDGVLVWVDPLSDGRDRSMLDPLLREVAAAGTWVSTHPDVILKMGVKEVLHTTRSLGWGTDTHVYRTKAALKNEFPARLANGPRVLKQNRGNGGQGIWKVELVKDALPSDYAPVEVLHAKRGSQVEQMTLRELLDRCDDYFSGVGLVVDQPFQPRLAEGMIRCYLVEDKVVGFGRQLIKALLPPEAGEPGPRIMSDADYAPFQPLRAKLESEWVPAMMRLLKIDRPGMPVIWDADFLYGPKTPAGDDTYVLCEINVSSVLPIPESAPVPIARCVARRLSSFATVGARGRSAE